MPNVWDDARLATACIKIIDNRDRRLVAQCENYCHLFSLYNQLFFPS